MTQHPCPLCSYPLLRHIRPGRLYWFCRHCYQEMFSAEEMSHSIGQRNNPFSHSISQRKPANTTLPAKSGVYSETHWLNQDNTGSLETLDRLPKECRFVNVAPYRNGDDLMEDAFSGVSETYLRASLIARLECSGIELSAIAQPT